MGRRVAIGLLLFLASTAAAAQGVRRRTTAPDLYQWIGAHAIPFATTEPVDDDSDLLPLRDIVGGAAFVGVGEATHGTHEFFTMKHRLFRFLVERMGFTVFSIEGALPECDAINDFVHTGIGSPSGLVANMHTWTWNADEVVDLVLWMRAYNAAHAGGPQLSFRGFDMQYSQQAIAAIGSYLLRVDPANANKIMQNVQCANMSYSTYQTVPISTRETCRGTVALAHDAIAAARDRYVAASSAGEYERILRYARLVVQFEDTAGHFGDPFKKRDAYMAENAEWIAATEHPGEKMMLWAYNSHIGNIPGASMGAVLRKDLGSSYLAMGFLFDSGDFNSRDPLTLVLQKMHVDALDDGFEIFFRRTQQPRLILDVRHPPASLAADLAADRFGWSIGTFYPPGRNLHDFAHEFDVDIWVRQSTASHLRP